MEIDSHEQANERAELHFLAALVDELMRELLTTGTLTRENLQRIEEAVSARIGTPPRSW